jgi:ferredoxin-NADP reductase
MGEWDVAYLGKRDRATATKTFSFERPAVLDYLPGQFFFIDIPSETEGEKLRHHFSYSSSPTEPNVEFTTRLTGHEFKNRMESLEPGTRVSISGPLGDFVARPEMRKVAYVVGGIGITPARSTIRWALDTGSDLDIAVIYGNRNRASTAFREELEGVRSDRIRVVEVESYPDEGWTGITGHIDAGIVRAALRDWRERHLFVSGPSPMVESLKRMLADEVGVQADRLITEDFLGYQREPLAP